MARQLEDDAWETRETKQSDFHHFRHSCFALQNTVNILTGSRRFTFVLSSFLQNDPLEHHLSLYRMMSGAQYNVTLSQIL